jgi:MerR family redox-sensitive transcriptional activator SoxR
MENLAIGEVARRAGIRSSAVRYYESIGLLPTPKRVNGQRRYDAGIVQLVNVIQRAQAAGFTIAEIQTLLHGFAPETSPAARWQQLAREKLRELDAQMVRLQRMKHMVEAGLTCGCVRLEACALVLEEAG